jgi:hypothetical protein
MTPTEHATTITIPGILAVTILLPGHADASVGRHRRQMISGCLFSAVSAARHSILRSCGGHLMPTRMTGAFAPFVASREPRQS